MRTKFYMVVAVVVAVLIVHVSANAQPTLARHIKIYTLNGKSRKTPPTPQPKCDLNLVTVSFATTETWKVGDGKEWSDVVIATGCNKETFDGGAEDNTSYKADCRNNPNKKGDLFSWTAVVSCQKQLCPDGWRVPTKEDFANLDVALRGTGNGTIAYNDAAVRDKYLELWGGSYVNSCKSNGKLLDDMGQENGDYWSLSERVAEVGYVVTTGFNSDGQVFPLNGFHKSWGLAVRCVR